MLEVFTLLMPARNIIRKSITVSLFPSLYKQSITVSLKYFNLVVSVEIFFLIHRTNALRKIQMVLIVFFSFFFFNPYLIYLH